MILREPSILKEFHLKVYSKLSHFLKHSKYFMHFFVAYSIFGKNKFLCWRMLPCPREWVLGKIVRNTQFRFKLV